MCPLYPFHLLILYALVLGPLWLLSFNVLSTVAETLSCNVSFKPAKIKDLVVGKSKRIEIGYNGKNVSSGNQINDGSEIFLEVYVDDSNIAEVYPRNWTVVNSMAVDTKSESNFGVNITGKFLGYTKVRVKAAKGNVTESEVECATMNVTVLREDGFLNKAFTGSVALLVGIFYVSMGCALDLQTILATIKKPFGPAIGFFSQFLIMPLLAYGIAKAFITLPALQLGLFITGCSPGGGASNIWTLALGGNLDLSITMTTISSFAAFVMMPLWILTLGSTIFEKANLKIPFKNIGVFAFALVVPLTIGIIIQFKKPNLGKFLVRALKPLAVFLIVFIVVFAIYVNLYLFQLFTWQILLSGMLLPWLGYFLGGGSAYLLGQSWRDVYTIGIETGIQNTGLAILALRLTLGQPEADLTTVLPVAVSIMTPVIPSLIWCFQRFFEFRRKDKSIETDVTHELTPHMPKKDDSNLTCLTPIA